MIELFVHFKPPDRSFCYVPVATPRAYRRHWVPAAKKLGLPWLREFETGAYVPLDALPALIAELEQVRAEFARRPDYRVWFFRMRMEPSVMQHLLERVDAMLETLRGLDLAEVAELFWG